MAGLFDLLNVNQEPLTPQQMGLLGMAAAGSQAYAPQPASRLPLAKPTLAYTLGQMAGGYGQGYGAGLQAQGQQISNLNAALNYNLWAPYLGVQPIRMAGLNPAGAAAPGPTFPVNASPVASAPAGPLPQGAPAPLGGAPSAPAPSATGVAGNPGAPIPAPAQAAPQAASGQPDIMTLFSTMPPPLLQRMGVQVPPELTAAFYAGIKPGTPEWQNLVRNVAVKASGVAPTIGGERPGVPAQNYNMASGTYEPQAGAFDTMYRGASTQAAGAGAGGLPAKEAEAAFKAGLDVRTQNTVAQNKAFYETGVRPPDAMGPAATPQVDPMTGDIATPRGTVVPALPKAGPFPGTDALTKTNTNTQETEKNFGTIRPTLDGAESRMVMFAKALQVVQSKGLNEAKAEISKTLSGIPGMGGLANQVMAATDRAAVQKAIGVQVFDVLNQLRTTIGPGQRLLNNEFVNTLGRQYNPDLEPQANYDLITQALGGIYQTRNMIDDYYQFGKPSGWGRDANAYVSAWQSNPANSYQTMINRAGQTIGPLKGMTPNLPKFTSPTDKNLQMLPKGAHFLDANGVERIKP